jgi:hypothetical protein
MPPYESHLGQNLVLRTVRDEKDVDRYVALNTLIWEPVTAWTSDYLMRHHPEIVYDDFMYVEDSTSGEMLSTTCLIPWHILFQGIPLKVAMLEMVGTHPTHRKRGLIRSQVGLFHQAVEDRNFDISIIEGIPYYYLQFGYGYAFDKRAQDTLPAWNIPDGPTTPYRLRQATLDDAPALTRLYQEAMAPVQFHDLRDEGYWRFLLSWVRYPTRMIEDERSRQAVGYVCMHSMDRAGVSVMESGVTGYEAAMAVLRMLKVESGGEIRLSWPQTSTLVQIARGLGSQPVPVLQWLVRIRNIEALLTKMAPIFEQRIAASAFAGLTADICLNLYKQGYLLQFKAGQLEVKALGFVDASMDADGGDIRVPPEVFPRLVFGYRRLEELADAAPDTYIKPALAYLGDILFPKVTSHLCVPYLYCGPLPPEQLAPG